MAIPKHCDRCGEETVRDVYLTMAAVICCNPNRVTDNDEHTMLESRLCGECAPDVARVMRRAGMANIFSDCSICREPHRSDDRHPCE
jgi:hypothetical protein